MGSEKNKELIFKIINCKLCGCKEYSKKWEVKSLFYPHTFSYVKCKNCGLIYQNPQLTLQCFKMLEKEFNYDILFQHSSDINRLDKSKEKSFQKIIKDFEKFKRGGSILDVGSGDGIFLAYLTKYSKYKWDCFGVEIQDFSAEFARKQFNLHIVTGDFLDFTTTKKFDVIYANASLEHLREPKKALDKMQSFLKPNGLLIIRVPNNNALGLKIFQRYWISFRAPEHFFLFSIENFKDYAKKNNLKILKVNQIYMEMNFVGSLREVIKEFLIPACKRIDFNRKRAVESSFKHQINIKGQTSFRKITYLLACLTFKSLNFFMKHFKTNTADSFRIYLEKY